MRLLGIALAALALIALLAAGLAWTFAPAMIAAGVRHVANGRGLSVRWERMRFALPPRAEFRRFTLFDPARGDTLLAADSLSVGIGLRAIARPTVTSATLVHARVRIVPHRASEPDTIAPIEDGSLESPRAEMVRRQAESLVRMLLAPARRLPRLEVSDAEIAMPASEDLLFRGVRLSTLSFDPAGGRLALRATGTLELERTVPFQLGLVWGRDDRLTGGAILGLPAPGDSLDTLRVTVNGRLAQERAAGRLRLGDSSAVTIGRIPLRLSGALERRGPHLVFRLEADDVTEDRILASVPRAVLGPLTGLAVRGSFDYRLGLDLDLARPDSVRFDADVVPHGLALDPARSTLDLLQLEQPFVASIHLRDRVVTRELSIANPFFRPLDGIDSILVHAVLANEDGGFFHHRGFNTEAIKLAIAADIRAGAWRRGAGTITMQLARNLWLGHARTLSRKAQEVVLAWALEHLADIPKRRLLEVYLNIVEWGPDVQGAAEAAHYYFARDPARVDVDEALFLATVLPAPTRWRSRFAPDGTLRGFERAQMHFIGRAMVAKGWLDPAMLPPRDSLRVELRGPARDVLIPPDSTRMLPLPLGGARAGLVPGRERERPPAGAAW